MIDTEWENGIAATLELQGTQPQCCSACSVPWIQEWCRCTASASDTPGAGFRVLFSLWCFSDAGSWATARPLPKISRLGGRLVSNCQRTTFSGFSSRQLLIVLVIWRQTHDYWPATVVSGWLGVYTADDLEAQRKVSCVSQCSKHFLSGEISSGSGGPQERRCNFHSLCVHVMFMRMCMCVMWRSEVSVFHSSLWDSLTKPGTNSLV